MANLGFEIVIVKSFAPFHGQHRRVFLDLRNLISVVPLACFCQFCSVKGKAIAHPTPSPCTVSYS